MFLPPPVTIFALKCDLSVSCSVAFSQIDTIHSSDTRSLLVWTVPRPNNLKTALTRYSASRYYLPISTHEVAAQDHVRSHKADLGGDSQKAGGGEITLNVMSGLVLSCLNRLRGLL